MRITLGKEKLTKAQELAQKLEDLQTQSKAINKEISAVKESLRDEIVNEDQNNNPEETKYEYPLGNGKVFRFKLVATTRFDSKTFTAEHPDLKEKYTIKSFNKVFEVAGDE